MPNSYSKTYILKSYLYQTTSSPERPLFYLPLIANRCTGNEVAYQRSHQETFCENDILKNFSHITEKRSYQNQYFNKVAGYWPTVLLTRDSGRGIPCQFCYIFLSSFLLEYLWMAASVTSILKLKYKSLYTALIFLTNVMNCRKIIFVTLSGIWPLTFYPLPLRLSGFYSIRITYGALKTCVDKLLANVTYKILAIFLTYERYKS